MSQKFLSLYERVWPFLDAGKGFQAFALVRQLSALLASIVLAKSSLTTAAIGEFETWLFLGLIITLLCVNGGFQVLASTFNRWVPNKPDGRLFNIYLINIFLCSLLSIVLYFLASQIGWRGVSEIADLQLVLTYLVLHVSASMLPYLFLVKEKANFFLPYCLFYLLGYLAAIAIPLGIGQGLHGMLICLILFAVIEQFVLLYFVLRFSFCKIDLSYALTFLRNAVPLAIYGGIGLFGQVFDAWLVQWYYEDFTTFAQFRFGARELPGSLALAGAFTAAILAFMSVDAGPGISRIRSGSLRLMHIFFPISILLIWLSPWLFRVIYNADFVVSAFIFNTYLLLMIPRWIFPHALLMWKQDNRHLVKISLLELILNVVLSIFLISKFGLIGVALATVAAFLFEKAALVSYVHKHYQWKLNDYVPVQAWLLYGTCLGFSYFLAMLWWQ